MKKEITIDGTAYVQKTEDYKPSEHVCVIVQNGWIFEGYEHGWDESLLRLTDAHVVRKWHNGLGIGGIASAKHKDEYTLDAVQGSGSIAVMSGNVIALIPLEW